MSSQTGLPAGLPRSNRGKWDSFIDSTADLKGPLSTIPDCVQMQLSSSERAEPSSWAHKADAFELVEWSQYFDSAQDIRVEPRNATFRVYFAGASGPVLFCLHGGGYTGLTWALVAAHLKTSCRVVALDLRAHGETHTPDDTNLAADTLTEDAVSVWEQLFAEEAPPTVLIGHSMGGSVAVHTAATQAIKNLQGLVVIDVVEGTALSALPHMQHILQGRPTSFPSLATAAAWAHHSGMTKSKEAAAVSLPSQLKKERAVDRERWVWRTNLRQSSRFWEGWYAGLSELFLAAKAPKMLILAGTDRLDKALTIGQMQGKFQIVLLPQAGHAVHEDEADRVADVLSTFVKRFHIGEPLPFLNARLSS